MSCKDRDENLMSAYPLEAFEGADSYIAELRAEIAGLKAEIERLRELVRLYDPLQRTHVLKE